MCLEAMLTLRGCLVDRLAGHSLTVAADERVSVYGADDITLTSNVLVHTEVAGDARTNAGHDITLSAGYARQSLGI